MADLRMKRPANVRRAWVLAIAAVLGMGLTFALGVWQWGRGQQRLAAQEAIDARMAQAPLAQADYLARPADPGRLHRQVILRGRWVPERTVYLDNRQMHGRPGFYVVTPLRLDGSDGVVLVQRGWVPRDFMDRTRLPRVDTPTAEVSLIGRIAPPPAKLYELGEAAGGTIRQNLDLAAFRIETGLPLIEGSIVQVGGPSEGLERDWPPTAAGSDRNFGYAFQWWALCALIFILYVWFQFIGPRRARSRSGPRA